MKYSLRSLMIVVLELPPLLAWGWRKFQRPEVQATPATAIEEGPVRFFLPSSAYFESEEEYAEELRHYVLCDGGFKRMPTPQAPAPIPPKNQSGPDVDP